MTAPFHDRARRALAAAGRRVLSPPVIGAAYLLAIVVRAATTPLVSDDTYTPGPEAKGIADLIANHYGGEIGRIALRLSLASIAAGAMLGAIAGVLIELRDRAAGRGERGVLSRAAHALALTAALHGWWLFAMMAKRPQAFVDAWYAEKGWARAAQVLVTDTLGQGAIVVLGLLAVAAYVAGSPARIRSFPRAFPELHKGRVAAFGAVLALVSWSAYERTLPVTVASDPQPSALRAKADPDRGAASEARPNVLILAADGVRFDRLVPRVAPRLSAIADRGTRFERAHVSIPHTVPSWVTLLTGRHPHRHGVRSIFPRFEERARDLDALPTRLVKAGYRTAVVTDFAGDSFHDIDLGFLSVDAPELDFRKLLAQRAMEHAPPILPVIDTSIGRLLFPEVRTINTTSDPEDVADGVIRQIRAAGKQPFFVTAFFSTSHFPYAAPAPYYRRFTDPGYRGPFKYHKPVGLANAKDPSPADIAQVNALYDGAVASVDAAAGRVLDALDRLGLSKNTIVVVTSDHGEALFEHGRGIGHGDHLFGDEVTHVPLAIYDPRRPVARREAALVGTADLAPTLYALTGVEAPRDLDGRSLADALDHPIPSAPAFAETDLWLAENPMVPASLRLPYPGFGGLLEIDTAHGHKIVVRGDLRLVTVLARHRMVREDRYKLVYAPTPAGGRYMLYDTELDPAETRDVAGENPDVVARMRELLWTFILGDPEVARRDDMPVARPGAERPSGPPGLRIGSSP